jgi:hypothetical protein
MWLCAQFEKSNLIDTTPDFQATTSFIKEAVIP